MNTIETIKELRTITGMGVMDCRKALEQNEQNFEKALAFLHELSAEKARRQTEHETLEGRIGLYSHGSGRIGVMVEVNTETEFASRSSAFAEFIHEITLQIAAASPLYVRDEDIPQTVLDQLTQEASEKAHAAGKAERIVEKIVEGALEKYKNEHVLLRQPYIRDENVTIAQLLSRLQGQIGENVVVRRFVRWELGPEAEA